MSHDFEVAGDTVWSPARRAGLVYAGFARVVGDVLGQETGLTPTPEDVTQIDPDVFAGFVDGLLDMYSRSNHQILHAHLTPVIEVSLVILERAGRPWPDDDPRLTPFKGYPAVGLRMPR
ncbi:MAG: hypothetical protein AUG44_07765 [Actinobacteria bacterium 13_1_20CM_3_71_11]|nr:MAG: hypothetical protein AUG44_07765 [Actinobacteria bacterium 13_1_20CM_3_71_11]TML21062.1 MAG: hypothetical protein E6G35_17985 [Actinomycetota bacterium]